jgi:hypothetical protein
MKNKSRLFMIVSILLLGMILSGCSFTGNVVYDLESDDGKCSSGSYSERVIKGDLTKMCCFNSEIDGRKVESCNSFDAKYSDTTIIENDMIVQRKLTFPMNGMSCTEVHGRMSEMDDLKLIPELSVCKN